MVVPIAQEHAGFAPVGFSCLDDPIYKLLAILIVQQAIRFQSKMDVSENDSLLE
jgi:hypothetical protein